MQKKYVKMVAGVLLAGSILSGCGSSEAAVDPSINDEELEISQTDEVADNEVHDIEKDNYYYYNYYKISDQERNNRLKRLDIKFPDAVHQSSYIRTLLVKDKRIIKLDVCTESTYYVFNNMDNIRKRDGILYDPTENSYCFYMYPMEATDLDKLSYTRGEFARNYVISVPQDMQVSSQDLKQGL